jgi:uncharacterized protein YegP (UPF0339 family)
MTLFHITNNVRYPSHILTVDKDRTGDWRWQLRHVNTEITAASSEGYKRRDVALDNLAVMTGIYVTSDSLPRKGGFTVRFRLYGVPPRILL